MRARTAVLPLSLIQELNSPWGPAIPPYELLLSGMAQLMRPAGTAAAALWLVSPADGWCQSIVATVPVGDAPVALAINKVTNKVYVGDASGVVTVMDGATRATTTVSTGVGYGGGLALNEVTNKIYAFGTHVSIIDGATNTVTTVVLSDSNSRALAINPITNKIYVSEADTDTVAVIDGATNSATTISEPLVTGLQATAAAVNPATNKIYLVYSEFMNAPPYPNVTLIDGATSAVTTLNNVGGSPIAPVDVGVNALTNTIYFLTAGSVTAIDGSTNGIVGSYILGGAGQMSLPVPVLGFGGGYRIAVNATSNKTYVPNWNDTGVTASGGGGGGGIDWLTLGGLLSTLLAVRHQHA